MNSRDFRMPTRPWTRENLYDRIVEDFIRWHVAGRPKGQFSFEFVADRSWQPQLLNFIDSEGWDLSQEKARSAVRTALHYRFKDMVLDLFFDVVAQEIPIAEFVMFQLSFQNCPRAFVEQLDRERDAGFWEKSGRVIPFEQFFDADYYHIPTSVAQNPEALQIYRNELQSQQRAFTRLRELGIPGEDARGIIGIHADTSADMVVSLRILRKIFSKRSCFFAQGDYWRPMFMTFLRELMNSPLSEMPRDPRTLSLFTGIPCDDRGQGRQCKYIKTMVDRIADRSSPVCPIFMTDFSDPAMQEQIVRGMDSTYGIEQWSDLARSWISDVGRDPKPFDVAVSSIVRHNRS
jgi:hypothetical protein